MHKLSGQGAGRWLKMSLMAGAAFAAAGPAFAADTTVATDAAAVSELVVTGTRVGGRTVTDSPVPVDVISGDELRQGGYSELQQALKAKAPSFSLPHPATAATLDFTSVPSLRGLSPGQTLMLINGKRRHSTGDLNTGVQIGRGDVAYDFNAIPANALSRVEVLRDGATVQYGADAIAGVVNLILDRSTGAGIDASVGQTQEGDGDQFNISGYLGLPLGDRGVLRGTLSYQDHGLTDRSLDDTRQQYFGNGGANTISGNYGSGVGITPSNGALDPREATFNRHDFRYGDAPYKQTSVFVNGDYALTDAVTAYGFGGFSQLDGTSFGFFRRAGQDETVRALFPNGYLPQVLVDMTNASLTGGLRGNDLLGFGWDLSSVYGGADIDYVQANSNNPSLGAASPTRSYRGGSRVRQWTTNFDLNREFFGGERPLKLAIGLEHRQDKYALTVGDAASYANGGVAILDGPNAGRPAPVGFQVTSGNRPSDAVDVSRASNSTYVELERQVSDSLLLSGSARVENFSDFGSNTTWKLASRWQATGALALRGSYSTGLRAPNLAQSYFSNTATIFISGNPVLSRLLPVSDPVARILGATDLKPEKSSNATVGLVYDRDNFTLTLDAYRIAIVDRIALSSNFQDTRVTNLLAASGNPGIGSASYLTNAVDTVTRGLDLTATWRHDFQDWGRLTATFAANYNRTRFTRIAPTPAPLLALGITTPLFDLTQQVRFTDSQPKDKYVLGLNWRRDRWTVDLNNIRYGEVAVVAFANATPAQVAVLTQGYKTILRPTDPAGANSQIIQVFGAETITDLEVGYRVNYRIRLSVGANNLFDVYPDRNIASSAATVAVGTNGSDNAGIFPYNYISPFGWNGRFMYAKVGIRF